jgi:hypothetical protein
MMAKRPGSIRALRGSTPSFKAPISPAMRSVGRQATGQQAAVAVARGAAGQVGEQRRKSAPSSAADKAEKGAAAAKPAEDDRPATLRNIVFVSSEVRRRSSRGCCCGGAIPRGAPRSLCSMSPKQSCMPARAALRRAPFNCSAASPCK